MSEIISPNEREREWNPEKRVQIISQERNGNSNLLKVADITDRVEALWFLRVAIYVYIHACIYMLSKQKTSPSANIK